MRIVLPFHDLALCCPATPVSPGAHVGMPHTLLRIGNGVDRGWCSAVVRGVT